VKEKTDPANMSARQQQLFLMDKLGYEVFDPPVRKWLNTGSPRFNKTVGSEELGIAYGKTYTLAGKPSSGKTLLATFIQGLAQQDGAKLGVVDVEDSCDPKWMGIQGCNPGKIYKDGTCDNIAIFRSQLGVFGKKKKKTQLDVRMQAAEELFAIAEKWMIMQRTIDMDCKICMVVDSTTAVEPIEEIELGLDEQNMRSKMQAPFLNRLTKRWNKVAANTNAIIIYIAQLRTNPMQLFGNPEYIPGGSGVLYYPSCINKVRRAVKGGLLYGADGVPIGVASKIVNIKNKVGGGSVEGATVGFTAKFNEYDWTFMSTMRVDAKMKSNKGEQ
jgi:RecA/RadA recombinase